MGVSEAPDRGLTAKQIKGEKTNWLELLAVLSPFPQTPTRTKGPRAWEIPFGTQGPAAQRARKTGGVEAPPLYPMVGG